MQVKIINKSNNPNPSYETELSAGMDIRAFIENKITVRRVNEEKNNLALKIIPELISSDARLGISGSFIKFNQIFEKKNAIEKPNKIKILKIHKYR